MELMDKVRQVGESYELNKYKTLNRTIELDARLANDRLLATKLRLNQVNAANEKLAKQLRQAQQQVRDQEKKMLVTETMLRQFVGDSGGGGLEASHLIRSSASLASPNQSTGGGGGGGIPKWSRSNRLAGRFRSGGGGGKKSSTSSTKLAAASQQTSSANETNSSSSAAATVDRQPNKQSELSGGGGGGQAPKSNDNKTNYERRRDEPAAEPAAAGLMALDSQQSSQVRQQVSNSAATQTAPPSRTRAIINELRQRLNLAVGAGSAAAKASSSIGTKKQMAAGDNQKHDVAIQTPNNDTTTTTTATTTTTTATNHYFDGKEDSEEDKENEDDDQEDLEFRYEEDSDYVDDDGRYLSSYELLAGDLADPRRSGRQRRRPDGAKGRPLRRRRVSFIKRRSISLDAILNNSLVHELPGTGEQIIISRGWPASAAKRQQLAAQQRRHRRHGHHRHRHRHEHHLDHLSPGRRPSSSVAIVQRRPSAGRRHQKISSEQKRALLVEFLSQTSGQPPAKLAHQDTCKAPGEKPAVVAINQAAANKRRPPRQPQPPSPRQALIVEYDLPTYSGGPIQLGEPGK